VAQNTISPITRRRRVYVLLSSGKIK